MFSKNSLILIGACALVGITIALAVLQVLPGVQNTEFRNAFSLNTGGAGSGSPVKDLPTFGSTEEIRGFLANHTDAAGNYPLVSRTVAGDLLPVVSSGEKELRSWQFTADLSQLPPDAYIVKASSPQGGAVATVLFTLNPGPRPSDIPVPEPGSLSGDSSEATASVITIDPIPDQYTGERLVITGTTTLPEDAGIRIEIGSTAFKPSQAIGTNGTESISGQAQSTTRSSEPADIRKFAETYRSAGDNTTPDILKTGGNRIYAITGNSLDIVGPGPGNSYGILSTLRFSGTPISLYPYGDRLLLIANATKPRDQWLCSSGTCTGSDESRDQTLLFLYSTADPKHPLLLRTVTVDGACLDFRVRDNRISFVTRGPVINGSREIAAPELWDSGQGSSTPAVYYFNRNDRAFYFTTVGSLDLSSESPVAAKTFLTGTSAATLLTPDHFYTAISLPAGTGSVPVTDIAAFSLDNGKIALSGYGSANGTLVSEYAMNEYEGYLQVVTEGTGFGDRNNGHGVSGYSTNVYTFDSRMVAAGSLEHIASGQKTYSPRFMGDRIYLGAADLSSPYTVINLSRGKPVLMGNLALRDNQELIYPYDATHIITIGKENGRDPYGGTSAGGIQISFLDTADVSDPVLLSSIDLGGGGSSSSVFEEPEAFCLDRNRSIIVLPLHLVVPDETGSESASAVWDGAYVFSVSPVTGVTKIGTIPSDNGSLGSTEPIIRALIRNTTLYTLSRDTLTVTDMSTSFTPVASVRLS